MLSKKEKESQRKETWQKISAHSILKTKRRRKHIGRGFNPDRNTLRDKISAFLKSGGKIERVAVSESEQRHSEYRDTETRLLSKFDDFDRR